MSEGPAWGSIMIMGAVALIGIALLWALFNFTKHDK